jgi:actin-related protein
MVEADEVAVIVIDTGTLTTKCGFAGDDAPRSVFRTLVGKPRVPGIMVGMDLSDAYVGAQALSKRGLLNTGQPVVGRMIQNWDDMEKVWHHAFYNELKVASEEHPVLLSEAPKTPAKVREKILELMFEDFTVPAYYTVVQAALGLYGQGKTIGLVVDSGEGATHVVPVYEGYPCVHAINTVTVSGGDVTEYLRLLLEKRGYSFTTNPEMEIVRNIKEQFCELNPDSREQFTGSIDTTYQLPDSTTILISAERINAPEALFDPSLHNKEGDGLQHRVYQSIMKCDQEIRRDMYNSITLVGGTTLIKNLSERLRMEVTQLAPVGTRPKVVAAPEREYSVWVGGSILASLATFQKMCITKAQYEEFGTKLVHTKC